MWPVPFLSKRAKASLNSVERCCCCQSNWSSVLNSACMDNTHLRQTMNRETNEQKLLKDRVSFHSLHRPIRNYYSLTILNQSVVWSPRKQGNPA